MSARSTEGTGPPGAAASSSRQATVRTSPRADTYSTRSTCKGLHALF